MTTIAVPAVAEVDRVVANLRAAREPVYDPTDPVQAAAVVRMRAEKAAARIPVLPQEAFQSPGALAAELVRIAESHGYEVDSSPEALRSLARTAAVLLQILVPAADAEMPQRFPSLDEPTPVAPGAVRIHGSDLKAGDRLVTGVDEVIQYIVKIRPGTEAERMRAGAADLLVAVTATALNLEFTPDEELYIVERPTGGELR